MKQCALILVTNGLLAAQCVWVNAPNLRCAPVADFAKPGPTGAQGPAGPPGPQGVAGPAGSSVSIAGGACRTADGTPALFAKLPDGSCLPVIGDGSAGGIGVGSVPAAGGTVVGLAPGVGIVIAGTAASPVVQVDTTVVPVLALGNVWSGPNNVSAQVIRKPIPYTMTGADFGLLCDTGAAGGPLTVTEMLLPWQGLVRWYKNLGAFPCTIQGNGKLIEGAGSLTLNAKGSAVLMQYDGSAWWVIARN